MSLRARIVAIVSSEEQATDDRSSLPLQVDRSRAEIERRGWVEVAPPIQIWQSRDFYSLDALRTASPEINELCLQAEHGELDLVVGRDHSRVLGRTQALQTAVRTHLQICRVQTYFYASPVEPVDPAKLGRRGRGQISRDYLDAIAAVRDEEEVARLVQRREDGMNALARRGQWRLSQVPVGYVRRTLAVVNERPVLGPLEVDPNGAALVRTLYQLYWDGKSLRACHAHYWTAMGRPLQEAERQGTSTLATILTSPVYIGIMVYGATRRDVVALDGTTKKIQKQHITDNRRAELALDWLNGNDGRTEEEIAAGIIVAWGEWEPIIERDLWIAVQREKARRAGPSSYTGQRRQVRPLSGLLYCGRCGTQWAIDSHVSVYRNGNDLRKASEVIERRPVYRCYGLDDEGQRCQEPGRVGHALQTDLLKILSAYTWQEGLLEDALLQARPPGPDQGEPEELEQQIRTADAVMTRWDTAFESGAISLEEWRGRVAPHKAKKEAAMSALKNLQAREQKQEEPERRIGRVRELLASLDAIGSDAEPRDLKRLLRHLIKRIVVQNKKIVSIEFN